MMALSLSLPALLAVCVLHPAVALAGALGVGPGAGTFAALGAGWVGLVGLVFAHAVAQRALYPGDWVRRLGRLAVVLVAPLALVVPATRAVAEAVRGQRSPFVRTLKTARPAPRSRRDGRAEAALAVWSALGLAALVAAGAWAGAAFQALLVAGFVGAAWAVGGAGRPAAAPVSADAPRVAA